jgi:hypothetical protein
MSWQGTNLTSQEEMMQKWEYCSLRVTYEQLDTGIDPIDETVVGIEFCDEERPDYLEVYQGPGYAQDSLNKAIANLGQRGWELVSTWFNRKGLFTEEVFWYKRPLAE